MQGGGCDGAAGVGVDVACRRIALRDGVVERIADLADAELVVESGAGEVAVPISEEVVADLVSAKGAGGLVAVDAGIGRVARRATATADLGDLVARALVADPGG